MHAQFNRFELEGFGKQAADAYLADGLDLNETITKLARENDFTGHQVSRVVENANILVNGALVERARNDGQDPRVTFPMAKSAEIDERLQGDTGLRKRAEVLDLFKIPPRGPDREKVLDRVFGKIASDPLAQTPKSVDHVDLARDFVKSAGDAGKNAETVTSQSLGLACQMLENLEHRALTDSSLAKTAMLDAEADLRSEIHDQILSSMAPATIRDVVKHAHLNDRVADFIDRLVTKVASNLRAREGESAFVNGSLTNRQHPLIVKSAQVMTTVEKAIMARRGLSKFSSAHQAARVHYLRAAREGR